jgi:hypothetical protein
MQVCEGDGYMQHLLYYQSYLVAELKKIYIFKWANMTKKIGAFHDFGESA